jgi:nucleoside-diphosphate-sugar epimerase
VSRVLVTGAAGFVGAALCGELAAAGEQVIACVRRDRAPVPGVETVVIGDICDRGALNEAVAEADTVVHLAAHAHVMTDDAADPDAAYRRVNVDGTRRVAEAALGAGVKRLVLLSSVKVNGEMTGAVPFTEDDAAAPEDAYGRSKWEAERVVAEFAGTGGMETVVIRAPLVYGPGVRANFLSLLALCDGGVPLPFGKIDVDARSLIYLGNLTDALRRALDHPAAAGRTYLVRDRDDVSMADLVRRIRGMMGRPPRLFPVPAAMLRCGLVLAGRGGAADRLLSSLRVDDSRIENELHWSPPFSMADGLAATIAWYRGRERVG